MHMSRRLKRWTPSWFLTAPLLAVLAGGAREALAQQPPTTPARMVNDKAYTREATFHLPVHMDQRSRDTLREVCLYVKSGQGDWVRQEAARPNIDSFPYTVPQDGEYWFKLVTIDKSGKAYPTDVSKEAPDLRVVVDRRAPVIDVESCTTLSGEFCLRCTVQDANPDAQSLRVLHLTDLGERALEPVAGMPGVFRPCSQYLLACPVRVTAIDLSGNKSSRDVMVKDVIASAMQKNLPPAAPPVTTISGHMEARLPAETRVNLPTTLTRDAALLPLAKDAPPLVLPKDLIIAQLPVAPLVTPSDLNAARLNDFSKSPTVGNGDQASGGHRGLNDIPKLAAVANGGSTLVLSATRASLDYRIDQVGPSGIGKVEVYMTIDKGSTWQKLGEDHDRRSPAEVDLPGEGLFGLRLAVTNGNGFGGTAPQRGDQPTVWIEVDLTSPFVQLRPIEPVAQNGALEIRWSATDKHLGNEPVSLYYRTRAEGAWQPIARHIKNEGVYRWNFPRDAGSQFFLRVEVADQAGNIARADSASAVLLDMTEPRVEVIGVSGVSPR